MLGISWFWFYGATFLTQFPNFAKNVLGGDEHVVTLLLALFSIGIGVGSLLCERLSGRKVETRSRAVRIHRTHDLCGGPVVRHARACRPPALSGIGEFLAAPGHWRVVADLMLIGLFGGFYIVPLYALIQERSARVASVADHRREQHPQRDLHGGLGGTRDRAPAVRCVDSRAVPGHRHPQRGDRVLSSTRWCPNS